MNEESTARSTSEKAGMGRLPAQASATPGTPVESYGATWGNEAAGAELTDRWGTSAVGEASNVLLPATALAAVVAAPEVVVAQQRARAPARPKTTRRTPRRPRSRHSRPGSSWSLARHPRERPSRYLKQRSDLGPRKPRPRRESLHERLHEVGWKRRSYRVFGQAYRRRLGRRRRRCALGAFFGFGLRHYWVIGLGWGLDRH